MASGYQIGQLGEALKAGMESRNLNDFYFLLSFLHPFTITMYNFAVDIYYFCDTKTKLFLNIKNRVFFSVSGMLFVSSSLQFTDYLLPRIRKMLSFLPLSL